MANKKKSDQRNKVEEFMKNVQYNRDNTPGFDSLYKLILWFGFIFILLLLVAVYGRNENSNKNNQQQTTTIPANALSYKALLDERVKDGSSYTININNNSNKYLLDGTIKDNIIEGVLETENGTDKFVIKDNQYYIVKFGEEQLVENFELNMGVINIKDLIKILENNKSLKTVDQETNIVNYQYNITINDIAYEINSKIENKKVSSINVKNDSSSYDIIFK